MVFHLHRFDQFLDLFSLCLSRAGTAAGPKGKSISWVNLLILLFLYQGERPYKSYLTFEQGLKG